MTREESVFRVPGTAVGAFPALPQGNIVKQALLFYYWDDKTKARADGVTCPSLTTSKWRVWICSQTCLWSSFHPHAFCQCQEQEV